MNAVYYRLLIVVKLKQPIEAHDIELRTLRTVPFTPVEGLTLVIPNDDDTDEHELVLGPPRYSYSESSFVEYQEDDSLMELIRNGEYTSTERDRLVSYYEQFGFKRVRHEQIVAQVAEAST